MNNQQTWITSVVKSAAQLRGLSFGNRIDDLLQGGLKPKTLAFVYGNHTEYLMNVLCGNSIRTYSGKSVFVDASISYDPYLIAKKCIKPRNPVKAKRLLDSIIVIRAFTCYQLYEILVDRIGQIIKEYSTDESPIRSIFVSGVDGVFNELGDDEVSDEEAQRLQFLIANSLRKISSNRSEHGQVQFVVTSSKDSLDQFVFASDTAIKIYKDKKSGKNMALLRKHHIGQYTETTF